MKTFPSAKLVCDLMKFCNPCGNSLIVFMSGEFKGEKVNTIHLGYEAHFDLPQLMHICNHCPNEC